MRSAMRFLIDISSSRMMPSVRGSKLWAQARSAGAPTADPKELDCDVLLAAQTLTMGVPTSDLIIATTNVGHLSQFANADLWPNILF